MMRRCALNIAVAFALLGGSAIAVPQFERPVAPYDVDQEVLAEARGPIRMMAAAGPKFGKEIGSSERKKWGEPVECSSHTSNNICKNVYDDKANTYWQTEANPKDNLHFITIDLQKTVQVTAISMTPCKDLTCGKGVAAHRILVGTDKSSLEPVAYGTWYTDDSVKYANFEPREARYVRLEVLTNEQVGIHNLDVFTYTAKVDTSSPNQVGRWSTTIDFPLVPVAVFIDPIKNNVVAISSFAHNNQGQDKTDHSTWTATWDPVAKTVTPLHLQNLEHDMFCPGMSYDAKGRMIITGGTDDTKTSIYDPATGKWDRGPLMNQGRGYQGQTTRSDGTIFLIGGSWSLESDKKDRPGERWNPSNTKGWEKIKNVNVKELLTDDWKQQYRGDNHMWLFAWKNNAILQAGPSRHMHWIHTLDDGSLYWAGDRGSPDLQDDDAMCGVAVMFDAGAGLVLTAGGARSYNYWIDENHVDGERKGTPASKKSFILTLPDPNQKVPGIKAGTTGLMNFARTYASGVVLPNGETFVVGGQEFGTGFVENNFQLTPEMFDPSVKAWKLMARHSTPRVYHSFAILLPDASVLVGGGGLCGDCAVNHFDAQIYQPPYLFESEKALAVQPRITSVSPKGHVKPGDQITITTDKDVLTASMVRYSGATHTVNNDQRRIVLTLVSTSNPREYTFKIHSNAGVAVPGPYMIFVMDSKGVPSVAQHIHVSAA